MKIPLRIIFLIISLSLQFSVKAQEPTDALSEKLFETGFENIRVLSKDKMVLVALENNIYRSNTEAISHALDTILAYSPSNAEVRLYLLKKGIPQIQINVVPEVGKEYINTEIKGANTSSSIAIDYCIDENWKILKKQPLRNKSRNKIDLVFYPQLVVQNTSYDQIYEIQLNIAPALEMDLWKGMKFTGQVILPIINDFGEWGDKPRPGFLTLAQSFRMGKAFFARAVVGNFNANRYGIDATVFHPLFNNRVEVEGNLGLTGSSRFEDGSWLYTSIDKLTWFIKARYYPSVFNLQMSLSYGQYLNGDQGIRADLTRYFGDLAIGFYAMNSGNRYNGGFHLAVPLRSRKRDRTKAFRAMAPKYFDWQYNAATEFNKGRYYETQPNENRIENNFNPIYIKNQN